MTESRYFVIRTLTIHVLLLVGVLVLMALGARQMYAAARDEITGQTRARQEVLASETAQGIENYYGSIKKNMDLVSQSGWILSSAVDPFPKGVGKGTGDMLWVQLQDRVVALLSCDRGPLAAGARVHVIGTNDPLFDRDAIVNGSRDWIQDLQAPSIGPTLHRGVSSGSGQVNLLGVPVGQNRALIAIVPVRTVEFDYLRPLGIDTTAAAWLVDQSNIVVAASQEGLARADLIGDAQSINPGDSQLIGLSGTQRSGLIGHPFSVGRVTLSPSMIAVATVTVVDQHWELFVAGGMDQAYGSIRRLSQRILGSGIVVFVVIAGILASTATGLTRSRMRVERLRHQVLSREIEQARKIQLAWLPKTLPTGPVDIAAVNLPATLVSGDFYNWFDLPDGTIAVVIGDVAGHGLAAAFLMSAAQLLTHNAMIRTLDPGRALTEANRQLCTQAFNGQFVTVLVVTIDPARESIRLAAAGHPPPLASVNNGLYKALPVEPHLMLGVEVDATYQTQSFAFPAGAILVLYTDGIIEAPAADGDRFGMPRLIEAVSALSAGASAEERASRVISCVDAFRGPGELDDDLTIVVIGNRGRPEPEQ